MNEPDIYRVTLLTLLVFFVAHRAYYNRKFPARENDTVTKMPTSTLTTLANFLSVIAHIASVIFIFVPSLISWAAAPFPNWLRWTGVLIALSGFGLLEWSQRALSDNWSDQPRLTRDQELIQTGPYKRVRHPIYTAFLLILGSTLLISANWLVGIAWLSSVGMDVFARIRFEESIMQDRFGSQYEEYRQRTGKLMPRMRRPAA